MCPSAVEVSGKRGAGCRCHGRPGSQTTKPDTGSGLRLSSLPQREDLHCNLKRVRCIYRQAPWRSASNRTHTHKHNAGDYSRTNTSMRVATHVHTQRQVYCILFIILSTIKRLHLERMNQLHSFFPQREEGDVCSWLREEKAPSPIGSFFFRLKLHPPLTHRRYNLWHSWNELNHPQEGSCDSSVGETMTVCNQCCCSLKRWNITGKCVLSVDPKSRFTFLKSCRLTEARTHWARGTIADRYAGKKKSCWKRGRNET